ncbi:hypothetical protein [Blastopirellula marina]|uniref:Uncharacterized protein n=1 Tax=Blastopirellula marina TaxID=124 RepID=A0A2S8GQ39_9BACT|nr:hypothetical protein [Blastopirellula marina]PQO46543.1 hypothetical protein C5Y93_08705 [Blastopirellula marina]
MKSLRGQSYPLIFLMLLVAFSAILIRIAVPIVRSFQTEDVVGTAVDVNLWAYWSVYMVIGGSLVGFVVGWVREGFWPGTVLGSFLGAAIGAICTPFLAVPTVLTAVVDLSWIFATLILLVFGTILIERRYGLRIPRDRYVDVLPDEEAEGSSSSAAGDPN